MKRPRSGQWTALWGALGVLMTTAALAALPQRGSIQQGGQTGGGISQSGPIQVQRDVVYGSSFNRFAQEEQPLFMDVYTELQATPDPRPAVVVIHGGGFIGGDKADPPIVLLCRDLARRGWIAASINYRLAPRGTVIGDLELTEAADDARAAVRFLRAQAGAFDVDEARIACVGSSAGAFTALRVAYLERTGGSGSPGFSQEVVGVVDLWGGMLDVREVEADEAPLMIVHGDRDAKVSYDLALELDHQAGQIGLQHEFLTLEGAGHAPWSRYAKEAHGEVVSFLNGVFAAVTD